MIDAKYFELLPIGTYTFKAMGNSSAYEFTVTVTAVRETQLQDMTVEAGCNAVIYLGNIEAHSVSINGKQLTEDQYSIKNLMLTISADLLKAGDNEILINGNKTLCVSVVEQAGG